MTTKVIIVAEADVHEFFSQYYEDWDTQVVVPSVSDMWDGLGNGNLSTDSEIIIFSDEFFDNSGSFEAAVATLAPEACVLIISYDKTLSSVIEHKVAEVREASNLQEGPLYFIDPNHPVETIDAAYSSYTSRSEAAVGSNDDQVAVDNISYSDPSELIFSDDSQYYEGVDVSHDGQVFVSTSSKGGSGKTTVGICTASTIALASAKAVEKGLPNAKALKVVIVDMDIRDGQIGFLINQTSPTALNIRLSPDFSPRTIQNNLVYDERLGIHALLAPKSGRTAEDTGPDFYRQIIRTLRTMFDVIILDSSVNYLDELIEEVVYPEADAILFVTNLGIGSVFGMARWFDETTSSPEVGGMGIPISKVGIVANQSLPNVGMDKEKLTQASMEATLLVAIPLDTSAVVAASNHNRLSDIVTGHPTIGPAYYKLAKKIMRGNAVLAELVETSNNQEVQQVSRTSATQPVQQNTDKPKKGFFNRGKR